MTVDVASGTAMSCQDLVEIVTDYLEGELDGATRTELEAHLALCPGCDTYLAQLRETIERLGHVPTATLSEHVQQGLVLSFRTVRGTGRA